MVWYFQLDLGVAARINFYKEQEKKNPWIFIVLFKLRKPTFKPFITFGTAYKYQSLFKICNTDSVVNAKSFDNLCVKPR